MTFDHRPTTLGGETSRHGDRGFLSRESKGCCPWRKEKKTESGVSKDAARVAKKIGFYSSFSEMGFCCQHAGGLWQSAIVNFSAFPSFQQIVWGYLLCASFSLGVAQATTQSHSLGHLRSLMQRTGNLRPPGGALLPRTGPAAGVARSGCGRSGRRRSSRRRLCDFGFDLPGDELIPLYNRLRGDRKMAARYLRRHGYHRARAGRGPGKIQPLWRRVSLTAGTSGGGLGSVAPAVRPWRRGPRARTGTHGRSQTPQTATRPVSLSSIPQTRHTCAVFLTVNVQPRVRTTQAQARLENDPLLCASLCTPGRPGYTLSHRSVPVPKACATGSNAGY